MNDLEVQTSGANRRVAATPPRGTPDDVAVSLGRDLADLPPLPLVASRLMEALGDTESSLSDLSRLISMDQAVATKVLRLVNSSYYGFPRQVTTVGHAVIILGFSTVRNLTLAIAAFDQFALGHDSPIDPLAFWEHCFGVAVCCQLLARRKRLPVKVGEEAFLGGLLHDMGKLFFCQHVPAQYRTVLEDAWQKMVPVSAAEQEHLGVAHTTVGQRIGERWNLPPALVATVRWHHDAAPCVDHFEMVALVSAADVLTRTAKIGFVGDPLPPTLSPEVASWLAMDTWTLQEVQEELRTKVIDAHDFLHAIASK